MRTTCFCCEGPKPIRPGILCDDCVRSVADVENECAPREDAMTTLGKALDSVDTVMATHPRDWSADQRDAWLYGVLVGWDEALPEVAAKHGWGPEKVERLRTLRAAVVAAMEGTS